jgi:hypothetical protein
MKVFATLAVLVQLAIATEYLDRNLVYRSPFLEHDQVSYLLSAWPAL